MFFVLSGTVAIAKAFGTAPVWLSVGRRCIGHLNVTDC